MSEVELDGMAGDEDSEASGGGGSDDGSDSSAELWCAGCPISSKSDCPIAKKKGVQERVKWGKTASRKVSRDKRKHKHAKKVKKRCGSWCWTCVCLWKLRFKKKWKVTLKGLRVVLKKEKKEHTSGTTPTQSTPAESQGELHGSMIFRTRFR